MIKVYSTKRCGYCQMAKRLLYKLGMEFEEVDITEDEATREWLKAEGMRTVPQIWFGDEHVGGYNELIRRLGGNQETFKWR